VIRVLHAIDHLGLGGAQSALLDLVRAHDPQIVQCEVAALHGEGPFAEAMRGAGIPVRSLARSKWSPMHAVRFLRLAAAGRFDVLHFHLQASNWLLKPLAALALPTARVAHDHTSGDLAFRGLGSLLPDALTHRFSQRVIAVSTGIRSFLREWEAVAADEVCVIPNGVDTAAFHPPSALEREQARSALGIAGQELVVGCMGRLSPEKNFGVLAWLARRMRGMHFLVAGEGPLRAAIEEQHCGTTGCRVRLLGAVSERERFYHALDVFLLPSLHEGLPMVLLEAMASGLPIVASALPDVVPALEEGRCGRLADPLLPETFALALADLQGSSDACAKLGSAARERAELRFSAAATARAVEGVYRELLDSSLAGR
jgi:glycosyltransferase involved in cell wall biosynthesis